jgi:serine/threonine-protein kinase PpkA
MMQMSASAPSGGLARSGLQARPDRVGRARRCPPAGLVLGAALTFLGLAGLAGPRPATAREALPMPGKTALFQRVLTRPGAVLRPEPSSAAALGKAVTPLSPLYVYGREQAEGQDWVEVGTGPEDAAAGWLPADMVVDWRQTLTVAFTRTADRPPTLFFRDRTSLLDLLESETLLPDAERLVQAAISGQMPADAPVIAKEPDTYVDPNREFYLLPILSHEEVWLASGYKSHLLEVAAVTLEAGEPDLLARDGVQNPGQNAQPGTAGTGPADDYRAGVVFVIDTTTSMGPYIERTRTAVQQIYERLKDSPVADALSFGLVAFRDNTDVAPGLGYVSRVVATLQDGRDPAEFLAKVGSVKAADTPSKGFDEDAYAGVLDAIESIDWSGFAARFVVLITDAGARDADDPLSRTRLSAERLRLLAQEQAQSAGGAQIAIVVLHLKTPEGRMDHERAATQYRTLSRWGDGEDWYFPVEGGSVSAFGEQVDSLVEALLKHLQQVRTGAPSAPEPAEATPLERKMAAVGRAMQLAYLGHKTGSRAPRLIEAWVSDRDLIDPTIRNLEVRVLITKNQLSNLQETLEAIFAAGTRTTMSAKDFFTQLRGAAATLARDPDRVSAPQVQRLADVGLVGEWLDDLPYTSQIMNLTDARWLGLSYAQQQEVLDVIEEKIRLYERIHDDTDRWIDLDAGASKGEAVSTLPLDALP